MQQDNKQKIKLLYVMEMLRQETDEEHPMLTSQIQSKLANIGISCERRTVGTDMRLLNEYGFEVMTTWIGHEKAYYVEDRSFNVPELKILIDAVQAASFITERKSNDLIDKISALGGSHRAEILKSNLVCFNTRKHKNEAVYYSVAALENSIQEKKKASFRYFDLDENKNRVYRKNGNRYTVEPVALVFNDDNYYLLCYTAKYDAMTSYRIDRMDSVNVEEEPLSEIAIKHVESVADYTGQAFQMFGGTIEKIGLRFEKTILGAVYDKFGEDIKISKENNFLFTTVNVQISPTFWGWVFQFGEKLAIVSPEKRLKEYKTLIKKQI